MKKNHDIKAPDLLGTLREYSSYGTVPMHMPGHKRNSRLLGGELPYDIDITEIDGFDNLHDMHGILKDIADSAAELYGADYAFPLTCGTTCGILSAIRAMTKPYDKVIIARNCHKSVYNALELCRLNAEYIMPFYDRECGVFKAVSRESVEAALEKNPGTTLVILTSPTYEGVVSDIGRISETVHAHGARLLVDCAHGAHFGFSEYFPENPITQGADTVVISLHKTMPALTQCALLLMNGNNDDRIHMSREIDIFETSSPSYVLMASVSECLRIVTCDGERLFTDYRRRLEKFRNAAKEWRYLGLYPSDDRGKLIVVTTGAGITGYELTDELRAAGIETEMSAPGYIVAMTSICDTDDNLDKLLFALKRADRQSDSSDKLSMPGYNLPVGKIPAYDAVYTTTEAVSFTDSVGRVSGEYIWVYPPGIPLLVPGEIIDGNVITLVDFLGKSGCGISSTYGGMPSCIKAIK